MFFFHFCCNDSVGCSLCQADAQLCKTTDINGRKASIMVMNASISLLAGTKIFLIC